MKDRITPIAVVAVLVLLLGGYVGSYYALVQVVPKATTIVVVVMVAKYRAGGQVAEIAFWPMNAIDRRLRPEMWEGIPGRAS